MDIDPQENSVSPWRCFWVPQLLLAGVMVGVYPLFVYWGWSRLGGESWAVSATALLVCWVSGAAAMALVARTRASRPVASSGINSPGVSSRAVASTSAVSAVLLGTLVRLGLPMGTVVYATGAVRGETGQCLAGMVVAGYLLGLLVETPLLLTSLKSSARAGKVS